MNWYEVRLRKGVNPTSYVEFLPGDKVLMFHHFWDEPWWRDAYVVRIALDDDTDVCLDDYPGSDHIVPWDSTEDEALYGPLWPYVCEFFRASSVTAGSDLSLKLVHCLLNAHGMSERDEAKFAGRLLWNRLTIKLRWKLHLKRRWERARKAEAVSKL